MVLSISLALLILAFDLSLPLGVAGGVPYVALVLLGIWFPQRRHIFMLAGVGSALTLVGYFLSPLGGVFWVVIANRALALFAIWVTAFLIASRKQGEITLQKNAVMLRAFLDATIDQAVIVDADAVIRAVNKMMANAYGKLPAELIGQPMFKIPQTATGRRRKRIIDEVLRTGRPTRFEDEHEGKWYDNSYFPVTELDGKTSHVAIFARDSTERKRAELDLIIAKERAEGSDRSKGEFLASMSHELRTPLNAIIGFSESMLHHIHGEFANVKYREYTEDIHHAGSHLLSLINDILDTSAIEAGAIVLQEDAVDVPAVVYKCIRLIRPRAERNCVKIVTSIEDSIPSLFADEVRVKEILLNVLSNATKFSQPNEEVDLQVFVDEAGSMNFVVSDKGIGMDEDELVIAMERFGRTESSKHGKYEGTGLGLPLSKALAELHGGTLDIESAKGHGTKVCVKFPKERVGAKG